MESFMQYFLSFLIEILVIFYCLAVLFVTLILKPK